MTNFEKDFIHLIRCAIKGENVCIDADFDWEASYELAMRHSIVPMIYTVAQAVAPQEIVNKMTSVFFKNIAISENQLYYINQLSERFESEGIDFVLLKGSLLKHLYPSADMRVMGDADILIKTEQYDKIKAVLEKLGFGGEKHSDPETSWDNHGLHLELHRSLFAKKNSDFYAYFGDGWKNTVLSDGKEHTYTLTPEAHLVYLVAHLAKHMRNGGVGVRHATDIYVYRNKLKVKNDVVTNELSKLGLLDFYGNLCKMLDCWFENIEISPVEELMTKWILSSGSFGTVENFEISNALKMSVRSGKSNVKSATVFKILFPPYTAMTQFYPFLKKAKFLLPFMYIVRIFDKLVFNQKAVKQSMDTISVSNNENIDFFEKCMGAMGLNFDFEKNNRELI